MCSSRFIIYTPGITWTNSITGSGNQQISKTKKLLPEKTGPVLNIATTEVFKMRVAYKNRINNQ